MASQSTNGGTVTQSDGARVVPARIIPVPSTVSAELQKVIALPLDDSYRIEPKTREEWQAVTAGFSNMWAQPLPNLRAALQVQTMPKNLGGVSVFISTPGTIAPANRNRLLIHLHVGGYCGIGGESGTGEAILMAHYWQVQVVSVDYRLAPDYPFPAALDDVTEVWKEVIKTCKPENMALFGSSAGGGLALATVVRLMQLRLPLPGALGAGSPLADVTRTGDTHFTNEYIDSFVSYDGVMAACSRAYAAGHDVKDPLLSPIHADFRGFPPTVLLSGTRDLFLSDTVRTHRKLRSAGVQAELHVFEGQSHVQFLTQYMVTQSGSPEAQEAYGEMAHFFDRHLGH